MIFSSQIWRNKWRINLTFGALNGVNNIELNKLESKVYEGIKINQNLTAKEINENLYI